MRTTSRRARLVLACLTSLAVLAPASTAGAVTWTPISSGMSGSDIIRSVDYQPGHLALVTDSGKLGVGTGSGISSVIIKPGVQFRDVAFKPGTSIGIAVGSNGRIFRTVNNGLSWDQVNWTGFATSEGCGDYTHKPTTIPTTSNPSITLTAVAWGPGNRVYLTGEDAVVLRSNNDGMTFAEVNRSQINDPSDPANYYQLSCKGPDDDYYDINLPPQNASVVDNATELYFMAGGDIYHSTTGLSSVPSEGANLGCGGGIRNFAIDPVNHSRQWASTSRGTNSPCLYFTTDDANYTAFSFTNTSHTPNESTRVAAGGAGPTVVATGKGGDIYSSTDGSSFSFVPASGVLTTQDWYSASGYDDNNFAVGGGGASLIVTSDATALPTIAPPTTTPPTTTPPTTTPPTTKTPTTTTTTKLPTPTLGSSTSPPLTGKAAKILGKYVVFKVKGKLGLPAGLSRKAACNGKMSVSVYKGKKRLKSKTVKVDSKCGYKTTVRVKRSKVGKKTKKLKLKVAFRGNAALGKLSSTYNVKVKK